MEIVFKCKMPQIENIEESLREKFQGLSRTSNQSVDSLTNLPKRRNLIVVLTKNNWRLLNLLMLTSMILLPLHFNCTLSALHDVYFEDGLYRNGYDGWAMVKMKGFPCLRDDLYQNYPRCAPYITIEGHILQMKHIDFNKLENHDFISVIKPKKLDTIYCYNIRIKLQPNRYSLTGAIYQILETPLSEIYPTLETLTYFQQSKIEEYMIRKNKICLGLNWIRLYLEREKEPEAQLWGPTLGIKFADGLFFEFDGIILKKAAKIWNMEDKLNTSSETNVYCEHQIQLLTKQNLAKKLTIIVLAVVCALLLLILLGVLFLYFKRNGCQGENISQKQQPQPHIYNDNNAPQMGSNNSNNNNNKGRRNHYES